MSGEMTRRGILARGAVAGTAMMASALGSRTASASARTERKAGPFKLCLNTSTIRAHKLPVTQVVDLAAKAGYDGLELWVSEIDRHVKSGGSLADLKKRITDHGLSVVGAIAFFEWMVDDDAKRARAIESVKTHMGLLAEIGCSHIAAPPCGDVKNVDLLRAAERYRRILEVGDQLGVIPAVEIWGAAKNVHRLGQAVLVALEAHHPKACILPDVYHLYKGGSGLSDVGRLNANMIAGFHLNDYPADPPREKMSDKHRIYPGDGIAPLSKLIGDLRSIGYRGPLSVELFNPEHAKQDSAHVVGTALAKMREVVAGALAIGSG